VSGAKTIVWSPANVNAKLLLNLSVVNAVMKIDGDAAMPDVRYVPPNAKTMCREVGYGRAS
jgi:hypothetical protein